MNITKLVKENIRNLAPYEVKDYPDKIKLDANESPFELPEELYEKYISKHKNAILKINRYPDPEAKRLKSAVAKYFGVLPENLLQGNGSDELIYYLIIVFGGPVLYPVPTFSMYSIIAKALNESGIGIPLDEEFDLEIERILKIIKEYKVRIVFLSVPNNPTGNCFSSDKVLKIIDYCSNKAIVVIDEAYQPFSSKKGYLPFLNDYKNLLIMRTFSKIGFAGLRVGFLIGDKYIIREINKVRLPFNVNTISQSIIELVIKEKNIINKNIKIIISERDNIYKRMIRINGVNPYRSEANFILFKVSDSDEVYNKLLEKGIIVRNMKGVLDNCLRVTVGKPKENELFLKTLRSIL